MAFPMMFMIAPAIATSWPALLPILASAAGALGYGATREENFTRVELRNRTNNVELILPHTDVVAEAIGTEKEILFTKDNITVGFQVDVRGKCRIQVWGPKTKAQLEEIGSEFAQQILQQYVYHKVSNELPQKGFSVVEEATDEKESIHLTIRRWR